MVKVIGTNQISYPQIRNFIDLPHGYSFIEERDVFTIFLNQYFRLTKKVHPLYQFLHYHPGFSRVKLRHFFNTISFNKTPWIVTFETTIPRLGNAPNWIYRKAINCLASDSCKKIIAISQNAYNLQLDYLEKNYPQCLDVIKNKMMVMHPPQKLLLKSYSDKKTPVYKIVFTIVGSDFFRKGGLEVLNVFNRLIPSYPQLQLNIVSTMEYGDYASQTTKMDYLKAMGIIENYPNNISHFEILSNSEVLDLFKKSHIGLLPTWGETYGYSVLEAQAAGCPVISTNLRALPEINNNKIGWVIEVPMLENRNGKIGNKKERKTFQDSLESNLKAYILEILQAPQLIKDKAINGLANLKIKNSIENNANILAGIYKSILK